MKWSFTSLLTFAAIFMGCHCEVGGKTMSNEFYYFPEECDFSQVAGNSSIEHDCSPKLKGGITSAFKGLAINGPKEVIWPKGASLEAVNRTPLGDVIDSPLRIMITGLIRLPANAAGSDGWLNDHVVVVAVNQQTGQTYAGKLQILGSRPDRRLMPPLFGESSAVPPDSDTTEGVIVGTWFGMDLVHSLGVPLEPAAYIVYATLGHYKSNVLSIETRFE